MFECLEYVSLKKNKNQSSLCIQEKKIFLLTGAKKNVQSNI
jgi:hypothetical protein